MKIQKLNESIESKESELITQYINNGEFDKLEKVHNGTNVVWKLKEPLTEATHCVYFDQDGMEQIEFEGSEDECNNYISAIQAEQDDEFGDEAPERFIKKLNEDTDFEDDDEYGEDEEVTKYIVRLNGECVFDSEDESDAETYYEDCLYDVDDDDIVELVRVDVDDEEQLRCYDPSGDKADRDYDDYMENKFDPTYESLNEDATVIKEGPKEGPEFGLASLLNEAIQEELKTIDTYNSLALTARKEGYEDIAKMIDEINTEENKHVGQLQEALKSISPNAIAIEDGTAEGQEQMSNAVMIDDDLTDDELGITLFKLK